MPFAFNKEANRRAKARFLFCVDYHDRQKEYRRSSTIWSSNIVEHWERFDKIVSDNFPTSCTAKKDLEIWIEKMYHPAHQWKSLLASRGQVELPM